MNIVSKYVYHDSNVFISWCLIQPYGPSPNPDDPLNNEAAELWLTKESKAIAEAQKWTRNYAK